MHLYWLSNKQKCQTNRQHRLSDFVFFCVFFFTIHQLDLWVIVFMRLLCRWQWRHLAWCQILFLGSAIQLQIFKVSVANNPHFKVVMVQIRVLFLPMPTIVILIFELFGEVRTLSKVNQSTSQLKRTEARMTGTFLGPVISVRRYLADLFASP